MSETTLTYPANLLPSEIDSILADLWTRESKAIHAAASYRRYAEKDSYQAESYRATAAHHDAEALDARHAAEPYETEYVRRGGWSRFFIVNNTGGHVHSSMTCSTCFATTEFSWLPEFSGGTEEDMVASFGEMACTVCFPSAPSMKGFGDGTSALARYSAAERAERAAEKAAKAAAKDAKSITAPDGSPLRVRFFGSFDTIRTIVAAERKLSEVVQSYGWYGDTDGERTENFWVLVEALLARGTATERIDGIVERAAKKAHKEGAEHV